MRNVLRAAALVTTAAIAVPITAPLAQNTESRQAQVAPVAGQGEGRDRGPGRWMREEGGPGMHGSPGMMRHMMMHGNPQERCEDRLAWRAAMRAYVEAKLNLTGEQRPLWDRVQNIAQTEAQKERQLCSNLQPRGEETMLDRLDRMQAFLSTRLEGLQAAKPAVQALYQALTPEQREIFDHPFHR